MEALLPEIMVMTLGFSDIMAKVKLASCNTTMQQRVFRDCSEAWETIDLAHCRPYCRNLSDFQLSSLLIQVNAREMTQDL
jgi:hypothetical protein